MRLPCILSCCLIALLTFDSPAVLASPSALARASANASGAPSPGDLAALQAAERRRAEAVASRDLNALRTLFSGDYYHVDANGRVRSKTELLQLLARNEFEFRSYEISDVETRMFDNGRVALVTGRLHANQLWEGRLRDFRGRFVRMWTLTPDGWRNTMHQSTEIRPAMASR